MLYISKYSNQKEKILNFFLRKITITIIFILQRINTILLLNLLNQFEQHAKHKEQWQITEK